jgi:hypothetical protein
MRTLTFFFLLACAASKAATITALNPGPAAFSNAAQLVAAGDTLAIPVGTSNWTYGFAWTCPSNVTVLGAGTSDIGGGQQTVFVDNISGTPSLLRITVPGAGVFRFSGISIIGGSGGVKDEQGLFTIIGSTAVVSQIRIDHCTFDSHSYSPELTSGTHLMRTFDCKGVVDHCIFKLHANSAPFLYRGGTSGLGNESWASATGFGTDDFLFFEDSIFIGGKLTMDANAFPSRVWDSNSGGKNILRFCTLYFCSGGETHSTGHAANDRSGRASETYGNLYHQGTNQAASGREARAVADAQGGSSLIHGNTIDSGAIQSFVTFNTTRRNTATYPQLPNPDGWGYVGPAPITNGTVNVSGTAVTKSGGPDFNVNWPPGTVIRIVGATCEGVGGQEPPDGPGCVILSVNSTTSITLTNGGHSGGNLTAAAYTVGSKWDGNTDTNGYPALDQAGRGIGDLITGVHPDKINSTTGIISWPNQALEPVYLFANTGTPTVTAYANGSPTLVVANRDYYEQASGIQTTASGPFDGTSGTGWGTLANRPTTCTAGVAYWATDQGDWNTSTSNPYGVQQSGADGVLYVATATDTWTEYYEPYIYPHPLQGAVASAAGGTNTSVTGRVTFSGKVSIQ